MSSSKPHLLPPSSFEVPAAPARNPDPWTVIQHTANEILQLQEAAKRLKDNQPRTRIVDHEQLPLGFGLLSAAQQPTTAAAASPVEVVAYSNMIQRQAVTIEQLQSQLQQSELNREKSISQLKVEYGMKESEHARHAADLSAEIEALRNSRDLELRSLIEEKKQREQELIQWKTEWQQKTKAKDEVIEDLERRLADIATSVDEHNKRALEELRQKDQTIENLGQQLSQLRTYLKESESSSKSSEVWKRETQELRMRSQLLENEKVFLISERDLVSTRLVALEDILRIQEQQISQGSLESTGAKKILLTTWREKVFELMVQLKTVDLVSGDEKQNWRNKMSSLEKNCKDLENKCQVLSHVVREKQAALDLESAAVKSLRVELATSQQRFEKEKLERCDILSSFGVLNEVATRTFNDFANLESVIKQMDSSIKSLNNRISFASGRIEMLQAQFARKEAMLKMNLGSSDDRTQNDGETQVLQGNRELEQCRLELEKVTAERNSLAAQIASDAQKIQERIVNATTSANDEASYLRSRLDGLHEELDKKSETVEDLNSRLENANQKLADAQTEAQSLKLELEKTQISCKNDIENHELLLHNDFERQINELKREQTKAVVRVRQVERQMEKEKERSTSAMDALATRHKEEMERLKERLLNSERDNNILKATLRQEGLLSKARRLRSVPTEMPFDVDESAARPSGDWLSNASKGNSLLNIPQQLHFLENQNEEVNSDLVKVRRRQSVPETEELLKAVAADLKHLASQVLNDDDGDVNIGNVDDITVVNTDLSRHFVRDTLVEENNSGHS